MTTSFVNRPLDDYRYLPPTLSTMRMKNPFPAHRRHLASNSSINSAFKNDHYMLLNDERFPADELVPDLSLTGKTETGRREIGDGWKRRLVSHCVTIGADSSSGPSWHGSFGDVYDLSRSHLPSLQLYTNKLLARYTS
jgi:hypothetical protein